MCLYGIDEGAAVCAASRGWIATSLPRAYLVAYKNGQAPCRNFWSAGAGLRFHGGSQGLTPRQSQCALRRFILIPVSFSSSFPRWKTRLQLFSVGRPRWITTNSSIPRVDKSTCHTSSLSMLADTARFTRYACKG